MSYYASLMPTGDENVDQKLHNLIQEAMLHNGGETGLDLEGGDGSGASAFSGLPGF